MIYILDYSINAACDILNKIDTSSFSLNDSKHNLIRNTQRNKNNEMIYTLILSEEVVGILKQDYNKFIVYFKHPTKPSKEGLHYIVDNFNKDKNYRVRI